MNELELTSRIKSSDLPEGVDLLSLQEAFQVFTRASATLQQSYSELQIEARRLSVQLEATNDELQRSLTEKERVRNYLKNILDSLSDGVLVLGDDRRVTTCNPAAGRLLGLPVERLKSVDNLFSLPIPAPITQWIERAFNARSEPNGPGDDLEIQFEPVPGVTRHIIASSSPLVGSTAAGLGIAVILKDVTRLKELEVQNQRAERLQAMGEMAVQLAHEIRNPLGSIELFASLLGNELHESAELKLWADQIVTGVKFLNTIVTNMLTFTRISRPQFRLFDLNRMIHDTLAFFEPVFQQRNICVERPHGEAPLMIEADAEMLRQMLINLLMNALQAIPERGQVFVRLDTGNAGQVQIEIEDSGIGIPEENLSLVFDPFFTTNEKGTGLGLSLVHQIITKHNGTIAAQSRFGKGTRFIISLPVRTEELPTC